MCEEAHERFMVFREPSFLMGGLVVPLDQSGGSAVPAGLAVHIRPALACAVSAVDFIRVAENQAPRRRSG